MCIYNTYTIPFIRISDFHTHMYVLPKLVWIFFKLYNERWSKLSSWWPLTLPRPTESRVSAPGPPLTAPSYAEKGRGWRERDPGSGIGLSGATQASWSLPGAATKEAGASLPVRGA